MNEVYSKKELKAKAKEVFEQYPSEDTVFAREDGNVFFSQNLAGLDKGNLKVYPFEKSDIVTADTDTVDADTQEAAIPAAQAATVDKTSGKDGKSPENRNSNTKK